MTVAGGRNGCGLPPDEGHAPSNISSRLAECARQSASIRSYTTVSIPSDCRTKLPILVKSGELTIRGFRLMAASSIVSNDRRSGAVKRESGNLPKYSPTCTVRTVRQHHQSVPAGEIQDTVEFEDFFNTGDARTVSASKSRFQAIGSRYATVWKLPRYAKSRRRRDA